MPEIPEMEIYKRFLQQSVVGRIILKASVERERSINVKPEAFKTAVETTLIEGVTRHGKSIVLRLSTGKSLLAHMMLDGRIYLAGTAQEDQPPGKAYVSLQLDNGSIVHFCDLRLGYLKLLDPPQVERIVGDLGIDPLSPDFDNASFKQVLSGKKGMIKPLLMQQKVIAGIGNAYSNEALFAAGILPERKVPALHEDDQTKLYDAIQQVLGQAIAKGGYIEDKFALWDNLSGGFIPYFQVYDRSGQPCYRCGNPIVQKVVGGRNAYFCTTCQH